MKVRNTVRYAITDVDKRRTVRPETGRCSAVRLYGHGERAAELARMYQCSMLVRVRRKP